MGVVVGVFRLIGNVHVVGMEGFDGVNWSLNDEVFPIEEVPWSGIHSIPALRTVCLEKVIA